MAGDQTKFGQSGLSAWASMKPGQRLKLRTQSPLHKGTYDCTVISVSRSDLRVTMPLEEGKLVLIPVGTGVTVLPEGAGASPAEALIVDRKGGSDRHLLLRSREAALPPETAQPLSPVVAVTSGKGGVGKSFVAVNLGAALAKQGLKTAVVDVDLGTANVDVLLNLTPRHTLSDIAQGKASIFDVLLEGPDGLVVLPGGSGLQHLTTLSEAQFAELHRQMNVLQRYVDVVLLDTGSGVSPAVTRFVLAADAALLVTTPDPHAIVDAYALVKVLAAYDEPVNLHLVVNKVRHRSEADAVAAKVLFAGKKFLQANMSYLGYIVRDAAVDRAVRGQTLLASVRRTGGATENMQVLAEGLAAVIASAAETDGEAAPETPGARPGRRPPTFLQRVRALFSK